MTEDDDLLEWLSFRQSGSRNDLPKLQLARREPTLLLWRLAVLAHVELLPQGRWAVAPPVLAGLDRDSGYSAILCGARTPGVLAKLRKAAEEAGARVDCAEHDQQPSRISVYATHPGAVERIAEQACIGYQADAAFALLAALPTIASWPREIIPPVAGRAVKVRRFSRSRLRWLDSSVAEASASSKGLFHIRRDWDSVTVLKSGTDVNLSIDAAAGRLAVARGLKAARLDPATRRLDIATALMPPMMISRALALSSGFMPARDRSTGFSQFSAVPTRTALLALGLMEIRLQ